MKIKLFFIACLSSLLFIGCIPEKRCDINTLKEIPAQTAEAPSAGSVNQDIPIRISFQFSNSCFAFNSLQETVEGNTRTIKVIASHDNCNLCSQGFINGSKQYIFRASLPGSYVLKFWQDDNNFISKTILVQ